jgi:hypothetical protein
MDWDRLSVEEINSWTAEGPPTPLLDTVNYPVHLKNFTLPQLRQLCKELRSDVVNTVSKTGGHLSSSLGVVELTVALHYVFNCPEDKLIWDVGHQCYIHKILTGRRSKMSTIRQTNGLSGAWVGQGVGQAAVAAVSGPAVVYVLPQSAAESRYQVPQRCKAGYRIGNRQHEGLRQQLLPGAAAGSYPAWLHVMQELCWYSFSICWQRAAVG